MYTGHKVDTLKPDHRRRKNECELDLEKHNVITIFELKMKPFNAKNVENTHNIQCATNVVL